MFTRAGELGLCGRDGRGRPGAALGQEIPDAAFERGEGGEVLLGYVYLQFLLESQSKIEEVYRVESELVPKSFSRQQPSELRLGSYLPKDSQDQVLNLLFPHLLPLVEIFPGI